MIKIKFTARINLQNNKPPVRAYIPEEGEALYHESVDNGLFINTRAYLLDSLECSRSLRAITEEALES